MGYQDDKIAKVLVGKVITKVILSEDKTGITFNLLNSDPVVLQTYGDWCSSTWIESLDDPIALEGRVISVEDLEMPDSKEYKDEYGFTSEVIQFYGLKITTEKGRCTIDYRNSSNGYYGGSLDLVSPLPKDDDN